MRWKGRSKGECYCAACTPHLPPTVRTTRVNPIPRIQSSAVAASLHWTVHDSTNQPHMTNSIFLDPTDELKIRSIIMPFKNNCACGIDSAKVIPVKATIELVLPF